MRILPLSLSFAALLLAGCGPAPLRARPEPTMVRASEPVALQVHTCATWPFDQGAVVEGYTAAIRDQGAFAGVDSAAALRLTVLPATCEDVGIGFTMTAHAPTVCVLQSDGRAAVRLVNPSSTKGVGDAFAGGTRKELVKREAAEVSVGQVLSWASQQAVAWKQDPRLDGVSDAPQVPPAASIRLTVVGHDTEYLKLDVLRKQIAKALKGHSVADAGDAPVSLTVYAGGYELVLPEDLAKERGIPIGAIQKTARFLRFWSVWVVEAGGQRSLAIQQGLSSEGMMLYLPVEDDIHSTRQHIKYLGAQAVASTVSAGTAWVTAAK